MTIDSAARKAYWINPEYWRELAAHPPEDRSDRVVTVTTLAISGRPTFHYVDVSPDDPNLDPARDVIVRFREARKDNSAG